MIALFFFLRRFLIRFLLLFFLSFSAFFLAKPLADLDLERRRLVFDRLGTFLFETGLGLSSERACAWSVSIELD